MALVAAAGFAETKTLPAAASIQGGNPFFSDVRVFNTSYTSSLDVTATYRCFIANVACPATAPQILFTLAPRQSKAFDDMVADTTGFATPDTAGGVEFNFSGTSDQLVVTSRLFSSEPFNSVGMFIPGLDHSDAHATTVLTSVRHDPNTPPGTGFRTNVGVFNPEDATATVTFTIFDGGRNQLGTPVTRSVPGHSGVQVSGIFEAAGAGAVSTSNAVIVVSSSLEIFTYAAVIDNHTADPIFVVGAQDQPEQAITPVGTPVGATPTPTAPGPTVTSSATVDVGPNGAHIYVDRASGNNMTTITAGGTVHWIWAGSPHSTTSDTGVWDSGQFSMPHSFDFMFPSAGTFPYHCTVHGLSMNGTVVVSP
jgi:plastocyanin